jgi:pimeloyl-ACP methyl ester carboxylesterase
MAGFPDPRRVTLPDRRGARGKRVPSIRLSVHEAGEGPAVVMCHGFPELAYSWRHQFAPLVDAGFRAIAPDQRGYGESDAPGAIEDYSIEHLAADLAGLLDVLEIDRAIFAGHDWGGFVAWAMPLLYPERTAGVIGVNTPYIPFPTTQILRNAFGDDERLYILWFQKPGVAEGVLDRNARVVFDKLMRRGVPREQTMAQAAASGIDANPFRRIEELEPTGPVLLTDGQEVPEIGAQKLDLPCLMITSEWDPALPPEAAAGMSALCSDLETHGIQACGHWTQQERPEDLNRWMCDWLTRRFGHPSSS